MQVTYDFSGKSVLLIGGTTGIGRATAKAFAKAGANLFVAGLGAAQGASPKDEIKAIKKGEVEFAEVDVRNASAMADLHKRAFDRFGRIDVAFNNAGVPGKTAAARSSTHRRCSASWASPQRRFIARASGASSASPTRSPSKSRARTSA